MTITSSRPNLRLPRALGPAVVALAVLLPTSARAQEVAALAVEIGRTAVALHHRAVNPRTIEPTQVIIHHQGDTCFFEAVMVWRSGPFGMQCGSTPRRAVIYGSMVNRADVRRLYDLDYVEAPDKPCLGCDQSPNVITYWNTVFGRLDTLAPARELGQPLHRSQHPCPPCNVCPAGIDGPVENVIEPPVTGAAKPFPTDESYEGQALTDLMRRHPRVQLTSAEHVRAARDSASR